MRIAIIETGAPPQALAARFGAYPQMMMRMLAAAADLEFFVVRAADGEPLPPLDAMDGLLITGSPAGVYERLAWMEPTQDLIRRAAAAGRRQVGICFGHQLMAEAFGGRVEKSEKGWGVGLHDYDVAGAAGWMRPAPSRIACAVSHQDQVALAPPGARLLARSEFCPYAALSYAQGPAISFQMHPEFEHDYARDLLELRKERFPAAHYDAARQSLGRASDAALIARWIGNFFEGR